MSNIKSPPIFNPDEDDHYCAWNNDNEVRQALKKEEPKRQGPAYHAFKDYIEYRRSTDQNFSSFVVEYEKRCVGKKRLRIKFTN